MRMSKVEACDVHHSPGRRALAAQAVGNAARAHLAHLWAVTYLCEPLPPKSFSKHSENVTAVPPAPHRARNAPMLLRQYPSVSSLRVLASCSRRDARAGSMLASWCWEHLCKLVRVFARLQARAHMCACLLLLPIMHSSVRWHRVPSYSLALAPARTLS